MANMSLSVFSFMLVFGVLACGGVVSAYFDEADFTSQRSSLTLYDNYQIGGSAESDSYFEGTACILQQALNVLFLIDVGSNVMHEDLSLYKEFILTVTKMFEISVNHTRVGILVFGLGYSRTGYVLPLSMGTSHKAIQSSLARLQTGNANSDFAVALQDALTVLSKSDSSRPQVILAITATPTANTRSLNFTQTVWNRGKKQHRVLLVSTVGPASRSKLLEDFANNRGVFSGFYQASSVSDLLISADLTKNSLAERFGCDPCVPNPCERLETCLPAGNEPNCTCFAGYQSGFCRDTDPCSRNRCSSGEVCLRQALDYHCEPLSGDIQGCKNFTCLNGGYCALVEGAPHCDCPSGYVGKSCQAKCPKCSQDEYCKLAESNTAVCQCRWSNSPHCAISLRSSVETCSLLNCLNGGVCRTRQDGFAFCYCNRSYTGVVCERSPCQDYTCDNGGLCVVSSRYKPFCYCHEPFSGPHCEINQTCDSTYCKNGGQCVKAVSGAFHCQCPLLYEGQRCEISRCEAYFNCEHGGVCALTNGQLPVRCICRPGYSGVTCEMTPCNNGSVYCLNGGYCQIDFSYQPYCRCLSDFHGERCQFLSPCLSQPCSNGGTCVALSDGSYRCDCPEGRGGVTCEKQNCRCLNGGTCIENPVPNFAWQFRQKVDICLCPVGYYGSLCEISVCEPNPCENGGTCSKQINAASTEQYTCTCIPPYGGPNCEVIVADVACASNPCSSPCKCLPSCKHSEGFVCESPTGLLGKTCSIPKPELYCDRSSIRASVDDRLYLELNGNNSTAYFYIGTSDSKPTPSCKATVTGSKIMVHRFSISSPFDDCHLSASTDVSGNTIIEGQIWLNIGGSSLYDMPVAVLRFQCTYSVNYRVTTSIRPIVDDMPPTLNSSSTTMLAGSYDLCKSLTCFNECPSHLVVKPGASYAVGDFINVVLKPRTAMQIQASSTSPSVDTFYISCQASVSISPVLHIVRDGCPTNVITTFIARGSSSLCVTFRLPRVKSCSVIYIHAQVSYCALEHQQYCSDIDHKRCPVNGDRNRRSTLAWGDIFGPIHILPSPYEEKLDFYIEDSPQGEYEGASTHASTLNNPSYVRSALLAVSAIGVFLLVFIFIYLIYSSYC